ncbi:MAG: M90 family metallopeptidase, partial [Acidimicrobiia bacterium]|nr:M90 family metallopeptidase [Acidimicrobiia bacterium]
SELVGALRWEGAAGFELDDESVVTVAANAAFVVRNIGLGVYRRVRSVVLWPRAQVTSTARRGPGGGAVDTSATGVIGLVPGQGDTVALAWDAVRDQSRHPNLGRNVVVHEFAHAIDLADGWSDGLPPLQGADLRGFADMVEDQYRSAGRARSDAVLPGYAWTNPAEFFAVASEVFFCRPAALATSKPGLYHVLARWYRQDPAARRASS